MAVWRANGGTYTLKSWVATLATGIGCREGIRVALEVLFGLIAFGTLSFLWAILPDFRAQSWKCSKELGR